MKKLILLNLLIVCGVFLSLNSIAQNILLNPGFENGTGNNFTNWTKANGAGFLNETTVAAEVHGGARALKSTGTGFPGQQWQVQLQSDAVVTTIGESYTFKLWINAATAGGTVRFSTNPMPLYGADTPVPAGVWTQLTYTFTANSATTQISLDLGESNVIYYIDDAQLSLTPVNLVPNASFENGTGNLFTNWAKTNGPTYMTETTVAAEVHEGTRALKSSGPGFPGEQYKVQLLSDDIPTIVGESYTFKIWAKAATAGGNIRFSTQPSAIYGGDQNVPAGVWTQLTFTFTANVANTKIALDLGQSNVVYYLDDMEMLGVVPSGPVVNLTNYTPNFSFEDGTGNVFSNWTEVNGPGSFSETTVASEVKEGLRALKVISPTSDAANPWMIQMASPFLNTPVGESFTYSIYVKTASGTGKVRLSTVSPLANYGAYAYSALTDIGTTWQKLTLTFVPVEPTTRIAMDMAGAANTYFVDDVSLTSATAVIVANGDFEFNNADKLYNWEKANGASLLTVSTTEFYSGAKSLKADVTGSQPNAGEPWSVQMKGDAINTTIGNNYTISAWVKAAAAGGEVRFSTDPNSLYSAYYPVTTTWQKIDWTFTANETQTKLVLDLGKDAGTYYIDDISIAPAIVNLVANGSFELGTGNDFTNWGKWNGPANMTETIVASEVNEGLRAVKVVNTVAANPYDVQLVSDPMTLEVNKNYQVTIFVKSAVGGEVIRFSTNATAGALFGPNFTTTTNWTSMSWTFKANDASTRIVLDMGQSVGTFYVDNMVVQELDACAIPYIIPSGQLPIANGKNKFLGMIYSGAQSPNLNKYWNQVTPENSGKWASVEGTQGVYDFSEIDQARAYAKVNNFPFRFHVLVWGSQQPTWLKPMTNAQKVAKIQAWFQAVANHYDGSSDARAKLEYIEVANEILNDPPNNLDNASAQFPYRPNNMNDPTSGDYVDALKTLNTQLGTTPGKYDWIVNSFKMARMYFPCETKLVLNEYGIESDPAMMAEYVDVVNLLKEDNLIDAVGMQTHTFSTQIYAPYTPANIASANNNLLNNLNLLATTNIPIMVTELDIDGDASLDASLNRVTSGTQAEKDEFQKSEYERILPIYWNHPSVIGVTLWGWLTGHWRTDNQAFLVNACNGEEKPALRDFLNNTSGTYTTSIRAMGNPPRTVTRAPGQCGSTSISPAKPIICPNGSVVLTASGCSGAVTWSGGITSTMATVTVMPTMSTIYTVTCADGGTAAVEVKVAPNSLVAPTNIASGVRVYKAATTIESSKVIGLNPTILNTNVSYTAGTSISLTPGFESKTGTVFKAVISGCL